MSIVVQLPWHTKSPLLITKYQQLLVHSKTSLELFVIRHVLSAEDISVLTVSSLYLSTKVKGLKSKDNEDTSRQSLHSSCFGYWKRYQKVVQSTADSVQAGFFSQLIMTYQVLIYLHGLV